MHVNYTVIAV